VGKNQSESEVQITLNDIRIAAFKTKVQQAGSKAKAKYDNLLAEIEQKKSALKKKREDRDEIHA